MPDNLTETAPIPPGRPPLKGRGALDNPATRYAATHREAIDEDWAPEDLAPLRTTVAIEQIRRLISRNTSPDIPFDQSVNPYRGCEHGCIYCYARPTHAYLGLSPGLDFESRLYAKPGAADCLRTELSRPGYRPSPIALGANTDPYQPIERTWRITRELLEVLREFRHPVSVTTKSALVERDIDILSEMAHDRLAQVHLSLATLDHALARTLEPRATAPRRRLETIRRLSAAGIPVTVLVAPVIPALTDSEIESVLTEAAAAGATRAGYNLLRLPLELHELFTDWLETHAPLKASRVLGLLAECHGGKVYRADFGLRHSGSGRYADMLRQRFQLSTRRLGLVPAALELDTAPFRQPASRPAQMDLFGPELAG